MKQRWRVSHSSEETMEMGRRFGAGFKKGQIVFLVGNLGSGKTTLVKGIAQGLQLKVDPGQVVSPTFVLVKEYPCRVPLYHVDLYRLDQPTRDDLCLLEEVLQGDGITVVEWGDKLSGSGFGPDHVVEFKTLGENSRRLRFTRVRHRKILIPRS